MNYLIYVGIFNIIASLAFVALSEMRSSKPKTMRQVSSMSNGHAALLSGIVAYSDTSEF